MRRAASSALVAALVAAGSLAGCDDSTEPDPAPGPGPSPTVPSTADEDGATDEEATDEGATDEEATDEATDQGATDEDEATDEDPDAPGLVDGPDWIDPADEVRVSPTPDAMDVGQEITGIRIAGHDDFDRVVLDLTGDEVALGWFGLYEDAPYEAGSGEPIDVAGNAVLSVPVDGINWTSPHPDRADGSELGGPGNTHNVVEVVFGVLFEGQQQVFVSVVERTPYRVFPLSDPARIVIDVQHP